MADYDDVIIPDFPRTYSKNQPAGSRDFTAKGPKADLILRMILTGNYSTKDICAIAGASASRVSECRWALDAAGIDYSIRKGKGTNTPAPSKADMARTNGTMF
jgi:hypothetical protein